MTDKPQTPPILVWFRRDLRLADNPALVEAARRAEVVPVYIHAPEEEAPWQPGGASNWWLHGALERLAKRLGARNSRLIIRRGPSRKALIDLARETGAKSVFWNRLYEPAVARRDEALRQALEAEGIGCRDFNAGLLFEPWQIMNQQGEPYKVFTPYYKACLAADSQPSPPLGEPEHIAHPEIWPKSLALEELGLLPRPDWAGDMRAFWDVGEKAAEKRLEEFLEVVNDYPDRRDRPDIDGTSRLSPYLHFGEIGPRQVWSIGRRGKGREAFLRQLIWRDFAHYVLHHFPHTDENPMQEQFADFPWADDEEALRAWQRGRTGYPLVDAGMRQLWAIGWMHNRVRMCAASLLTKDLLIPWQEGARWFWDTLVDANLANNSMGWQWTAGSGVDAAPYFRIFNPVTQSRRFDPGGGYIRRWVPELAALPDKHIHAPWEAPAALLEEVGIRLGRDYPEPIVEHGMARNRALEAYEEIKAGSRR